ncbi:MAG: hypothetical protein AAFY75_04185 [Pseudomonadota bacterium]
MMEVRNARVLHVVSPDAPRAPDGRVLIGVRGLLEWAFGAECASIDHNEVGRIGPDGFSHRSATANICDMLALGDPTVDPGRGVKVDASGGRSLPHDDAEFIATVVRAQLSWHDAVRVAELARAGMTPKWDLPPTRCQPRDWKGNNQHGQWAQTEAMVAITYRDRGRLRRCTPVICPVHYAPTAQQIGAARRAYLQWLINLSHVRVGLKPHEFKHFVLTDAFPVARPWQKGG